MKKRISWTLLALSCAALLSPLSAKDYHVAGCGLGSLIFKENKMLHQILALTTNVTGFQTIGITIGTSNCKTDGLVKTEKVQEVFVAVNYSSLEQEMVSGKGEKLDALSSLLGCPSEMNERFSTLTQNRYSKLFVPNGTPATLLDGVKNEIRQDEVLASACKI
ncbi:DUF3015 domain-containing protein [Leptospira yasudae]|uniref:DUF3015 family protein n=1 Tax=Leptospira yasudae TaxID=2202201 RepID=UPI0010833A03|nr:DUF3015 family protein [Leptospira yasudae]TGK25538.1 DUF3015 domain-containing protein [Leptospira yasudae]TGM02637.1 DUF3015 domain-containing protein [Leptospira yasudae]